jgi:hypothetical protein
MRAEIHIALVHHPVVNKTGDIVATAVTNLDIHDNARSSRTYGVKSYHIVTPLDAQVELVTRILDHWRSGFGARRVPNRVDAMNLVRVSRTLEEVVEAISRDAAARPVVVATAARRLPGSVTYAAMRERMQREPGPFLIVFGTGYGLADSIIASADALIEPIGDPSDWNHLSVRAATAITLDRLLGERSFSS